MNCLVSVAIFPIGEGDHLSSYVAKSVKLIKESGLDYQFTAMNTLIEGPLDEVMDLVKEASLVLAEEGIRTYVTMNMDIRSDRTERLTGKVESVNQLLAEKDLKESD